MMKNQVIPIMAVIVIVAAAAGGWLLMNDKGSGSGDFTIEDMRDRSVSIPNDLDSVLPMNCCTLEIISYFESVKKVAAIDKDDIQSDSKIYTKALANLFSSLETFDRNNTEKIIGLDPSLIITSTVDVTALDKLQADTGIPVFAINADLEFGDDAWFSQIEKLGRIFGENDRAKEIVDGIRSVIKEITDRRTAEDISGYTCGMMFKGKGDFLKTSGDWLPFDYAGVTNVMKSGPQKQPYDTAIEKVVGEEIDYIFIDNSNLSATVNELKGYIANSGLSNRAIGNDDIYSVYTYKDWGTQFDAVLLNCLYVAKTVNPSGYAWDFDDKADSVLKLLYGDSFGISYVGQAAPHQIPVE